MDNEITTQSRPDDKELLKIMNAVPLAFDQTSGPGGNSDRIHNGFKITGPGKYRYDTDSKREDKSLIVAIISCVFGMSMYSLDKMLWGHVWATVFVLSIAYRLICRDFFEIDCVSKKIFVKTITATGIEKRLFVKFQDIENITMNCQTKSVNHFPIKYYCLRISRKEKNNTLFSNLVNSSRYDNLVGIGKAMAGLLETDFVLSDDVK